MFENSREPIYADIAEPSTKNKLVRKKAIRLGRDSRKPPLPPVSEDSDGNVFKYRMVNRKTSKQIPNIEDGTSISDDIETDTKSSVLPPTRHLNHRTASNSSKISSTGISIRDKNLKLNSRQKLTGSLMTKMPPKISQISNLSDSGIFPSIPDDQSFIEDELMRFSTFNKQDMMDLPKRLRQLINMYQMKLQENEQMIQLRENEIARLREDNNIMESENSSLKQMIDEIRSDCPPDIEEWRLIQDQAKLVLEENENLNSQVKLLHSKLRQSHVAHRKEMTELMQKLEMTEDHLNINQAELIQLRTRFDNLREDYNLLILQSQDLMSRDDHTQAVRESKRFLDDLRNKYDVDVEKANEIIKRLQSEKSALTAKLINVSTENEQLTVENGVLLTMHKKDLSTSRRLRKISAKYKSDAITVKFKLRALHNQVTLLEKEKTKLAATAKTATDEVKLLLSNIESAASHEARIKHLLANKISILDELRRLTLREEVPNEDKHRHKSNKTDVQQKHNR
ncbi:hypothetical protein CHUAL_011782 [Chamberlinius hualienensis]